MLTVLTLLKLKPSPDGARHGERAFWREWGQAYLDKWISSVLRYVPGWKRIIVMTDAPEQIVLRYTTPSEATFRVAILDSTIGAPGFWAKLEMFRHGVGKSLYLDLDNVIRGPLDELCALTPDPLIMLDDRRVPGLPNGSMILFDADRCRGIWEHYTKRPRQYERDFRPVGADFGRAYDQAFIAEYLDESGHEVSFFQSLLPPSYILNARSELPNVTDLAATRVLFGGGAEGKPHLSPHPAFSLA